MLQTEELLIIVTVKTNVKVWVNWNKNFLKRLRKNKILLPWLLETRLGSWKRRLKRLTCTRWAGLIPSSLRNGPGQILWRRIYIRAQFSRTTKSSLAKFRKPYILDAAIFLNTDFSRFLLQHFVLLFRERRKVCKSDWRQWYLQ